MSRIIVTDISPTVSEKTIKKFFLFCGRIKEFELVKDDKCDNQIATITFEKAAAAKTALMLTNAVLDDSQITVKLDEKFKPSGDESSGSGEGLEQEDKPMAAIFSEILAAGYKLTDSIIQKGIEFDASIGLSSRVLNYLKSLDEQYHVSETVTAKAAEINEKLALQDKVKYAATQVQDTATRALDTNAGKKLAEYYLNTSKQVVDVHQEARRIANESKSKTEIDSATQENVEVQHESN